MWHPGKWSSRDCASPFAQPGRQTVYLGGYDPDDYPSSDTAWVYSTDLANLFAR